MLEVRIVSRKYTCPFHPKIELQQVPKKLATPIMKRLEKSIFSKQHLPKGSSRILICKLKLSAIVVEVILCWERLVENQQLFSAIAAKPTLQDVSSHRQGLHLSSSESLNKIQKFSSNSVFEPTQFHMDSDGSHLRT